MWYTQQQIALFSTSSHSANVSTTNTATATWRRSYWVFRVYKKATPRKDDKWAIQGFKFDRLYISIRKIHFAGQRRSLKPKIGDGATARKLSPMVLQTRVTTQERK